MYERILKEIIFECPQDGILMDFLISIYPEDFLINGIKNQRLFADEDCYDGIQPKEVCSYLLIYKDIYDLIAKETDFSDDYLEPSSKVTNIEDAFDYIYVVVSYHKEIYAHLIIEKELVLDPELHTKINVLVDEFNVKLKQFIKWKLVPKNC